MDKTLLSERLKLSQELSQKLPGIRKAYHFSQEDLSHLIGKSRQAVSLMERGTLRIAWDTTLAIVFIFYTLDREKFQRCFSESGEKLSSPAAILKRYTALLGE